MSLTNAQVAKIAKLSRIRLEPGETEHMAKQMNSILGWIEQLQEVDVDGVPPMAGVGENIQRLRRDEVTDGACQDKVLSNAPKASYGCYVVPKVVE